MKKISTLILLALSCATMRSQTYCMVTDMCYDVNQPGITNFKMGTINRTSSNVESMSSCHVITGQTVTLTIGATYTISLSHSEDQVNGPPLTGARNNLRIWIDYNKDFVFDNFGSELAMITNSQTPNTTYTASITIPSTVTPGTTRMRVTAKMSADAGHTLPTPCDSPPDPIDYHGEIEDYDVVFVTAPTVINEQTNSHLSSFALYPNPANESSVLSFHNSETGSVSINLQNLLGKNITTVFQGYLSAGDHSISLDQKVMQNLANGVYLVTLDINGIRQTKRLVISK